MDPSKQLVFLVGVSGVGKSYFSYKVAQAMGLGHGDLDDYLVHLLSRKNLRMTDFQKPSGSSMDLLSAEGESFRVLESAALKDMTQVRNHVISLGGGTTSSTQNQHLIRRCGALVIWLEDKLHIIAQRMHILYDDEDLKKRPFLWDALTIVRAREEPIDAVTQLHQALEMVYAHRVSGYENTHTSRVDCSYMSCDLVVSEIIAQIKEKWDYARHNP